MRERGPLRRLFSGLVALALIGLGVSMLIAEPALSFFLVLIGLLVVVALFTGSRGMAAGRSSDQQSRAARSRGRAARPGLTHRVAAQAMQRAGHDPNALAVAPVDLGALVYHGTSDPAVYREKQLPNDADYVRPFAVIRTAQRAQGKIRFELLDGRGVRRFVDEARWQLRAGETFVYPSTWLPLRSVPDFDGRWELRLYAADVLLAAHDLYWWDSGGGALRAHLTGDGEIKDALAEELSRLRLERLSLDDMLDEDGGIVERDPESEALAREAERRNRQYRRG